MNVMTMGGAAFLLLTTFLLATAFGGVRKPFDVRIVGGDPAEIEDYPYQVSVIYVDSHFCGGSILNVNYVLTAAHCTNKISADNLLVRAGSSMIDEGGQLIQVAQIIQHNQFDPDTYDYDISILRLQSSLSLGSGVQAVNIPSQDESDVEGDLLGTATGWGRLSDGGPLPLELQKVELPTIRTDICNMVYGDALTSRMFCAGYVEGQKDTCQGDSGGPYVYKGLLLGITSWGDGCGKANSPGVYTKVSFFRTYIDSIINS